MHNAAITKMQQTGTPTWTSNL